MGGMKRICIVSPEYALLQQLPKHLQIVNYSVFSNISSTLDVLKHHSGKLEIQ
jgi:hypothetical protein